jgi:4-amino-4-deoxy-L-arabinose transferase-like glycosyltransferase
MSFWLLAIYGLFGPSLLAAQLANASLGGLLTWLTYDVGRRVVPDPAARLAAVLTAVFPSLVLYATTLGYDALLGCAILAAACLFLRRGAARSHAWWYVGLVGALLGLAAFIKPIGLLLPGVFGVSYWRRGTPVVRSVRNTLILTAALFAVVLPWSIRNDRVLGEFVLVTTSGGVGLWVTNHPGAGPLTTGLPDLPPGTTEVERDRILRSRALSFLRRHPDHLFRLAPAKAAYQWGTSSSIMAFVSADRWPRRLEDATKLVLNAAWACVCALVVVAVVRDRAFRSPHLFWPLLALLAYVWGIHQFYEAQSRYHLPVLPVLFIVAATAVLRRPATMPRASE